jgi:hypothetical protein
MGRLLQKVRQETANTVNKRLDRCARGEKLGIDDECQSGCDRERSAFTGLNEQLDGCGRKTEVTQAYVPGDRGDVIFGVVGVGPPAAGRRDEAFRDEIPNLSFRYPGTGSEIPNIHARSFRQNLCRKRSAMSIRFYNYFVENAMGGGGRRRPPAEPALSLHPQFV